MILLPIKKKKILNYIKLNNFCFVFAVALAIKNLLRKDLTSCKCVLPCYGIIYEKSIKKSNLTILNGNLEYGILDIHFTSKGGMKYLTEKRFPVFQLIGINI